MSKVEVRAGRSCVTKFMYLRLCVAEEKRTSWGGLGVAFQDSRWLRDLIWTCCIWAPRGMAYCNKGPANEGPDRPALCAPTSPHTHKGLLHPGGGVPNPTVTADYGQDLADTEAEELEINDHRVHQTVAQLSNEERSSKGNRLVLMHAFIVRRNSAPS